MREIKTVGLAGTGTIGAGWAARALFGGCDVIAADPNPDCEPRLRQAVDAALEALAKLVADAPRPALGALSFTTDLAEMAQSADFVQESVPETLSIKQSVYQTLTKHAASDVVIGSSTSGFMPSELQEGQTTADRILVGHPFNPVYLCPLVEIVPGAATSEAAVAAATEFYASIGMHPLRVRREVPGHLSDRLQEAMWREILHALNDDIATTGELDDAIRYGPGLRWAIMGMNQIYMLGGGAGGARHFMKQFGPALEWPWTHLKAPPLTDEIIDRFADGTEAQAAGRSIPELEKIRDDCLVAIQRVLKHHGVGAGQTLADFEARLAQKAGG